MMPTDFPIWILCGSVDVAGHDADFAFAGGDDAGAVGADEYDFWVILEEGFGLDHVEHGDAFGDGDDDGDAGVGGFHDGVGGEGGRDEDHGGVGAGGVDGLADGVEDGQAVGVFGAALAGGDAADHFGAVFEASLGMKRRRRCR